MLRAFALSLCCAAATAQPLPDLVTDRPDFTESAVVVPLGHVQLEGGLSLVGNGPVDSFSGPELLVRWTPLPRFELRFGAPNYIDTEGDNGFDNPSLGVKVQLGPFAQWDLAALATVSTFPDGSVDPEVIVTAARPLSARPSLGGQVFVTRDGGAGTWIVGGTVVRSVSLSERWGLFAELAVTAPEDAPAEILQHSGVTFALSPNLQLDAHVGLGLNDAAPDTILGLGLAVRR